MFRDLFGKYRFLVISIALFLIFDLGVLVLNFYTSGQIAQQTERINLAGRQRTLTQQMSKATLYIKAQKLQQWVYQSGLEELRDHYRVFGKTIDALTNGGETTSAETGETIVVNAVLDPKGRAILDEGNVLWKKFEQAIEPLMVDILITDEEIKPASEFIASNNLALFELMNQLTEHFTDQAEAQTQFLRRVQVAGITLATINFFIILLHFLRQLRGRDRALEVKQNESDQILQTILEGVFLLDKDLRIGGQHSSFLRKIFNLKKISGRSFEKFLGLYFAQDVVKTAIEFVELYDKKHINPDLINDVNPLKSVAASVPTKTGEVLRKYLDFTFSPLKSKGQDSAILVTVKDITDSVLLEEQARHNEENAKHQLELFSQILPIAASDLEVFVNEANQALDDINTHLRTVGASQRSFEEMLVRVLREAHKLKGNASALKFEWMVEQLHEFENELQTLKDQNAISVMSGRDLLPLTIRLKTLYDNLEAISELQQRLHEYGINSGERPIRFGDLPLQCEQIMPTESQRWFNLESLIARAASEAGVEAELRLRGFLEALPKDINDKLYSMAVQLVRNSLAHGIESKAQRETLKKPNAGQISISVSHDQEGNYRFIFEDDGRGFDYRAIRLQLVENGDMSEGEAQLLSNTELVRRTFADSFSTKVNADQFAGRGMGLSVVWQQVKALGGRLKIRSVTNEFTQFIVDFEA